MDAIIIPAFKRDRKIVSEGERLRKVSVFVTWKSTKSFVRRSTLATPLVTKTHLKRERSNKTLFMGM